MFQLSGFYCKLGCEQRVASEVVMVPSRTELRTNSLSGHPNSSQTREFERNEDICSLGS